MIMFTVIVNAQNTDIINTLSSSGAFLIKEDNGSTLVSVKEISNHPAVKIGNITTSYGNSTLQVEGSLALPVTTITGTTTSYDVTSNDYTIVGNTSSDLTINLPSASDIIGRIYVIKNYSGKNVTINPASGETIDGNTSLAINTAYQFVVLQVVSSGAWIIIGGN
jgi:hypothetical protein